MSGAEEDRYQVGGSRFWKPGSALPPAECTFINSDDFCGPFDGQALSPSLSQKLLAKQDPLCPRLMAKVSDDLWKLVDEGSALIALPPYPRLRIDADNRSGINHSMVKFLATKT